MCPALPAAVAEGSQIRHGEDLTGVAGLAAAEARRADDLVDADSLFRRIRKTGVEPRSA